MTRSGNPKSPRSRDASSPGESQTLVGQSKSLLRQFGLHARKGLGQHFLIDRNVLGKSISAADLGPDDVVVEVGPGLGILTEELAKTAKVVIAIEVDPQMSAILSQRLGHLSNVTIVEADVLEVDITEVVGSAAGHGKPGYKVVANLPYFIATAAIRGFLEAEIKPERMVVMVQKEIAQNIVAAGGKNGILSISVALYGKPSLVSYVRPRSFYPPPEVDSAIVRIDVYEGPALNVNTDDFFRVVKAGFSSPRKQLRNSLAHGLSIPPSTAAVLLNEAGISLQRRAETLSLEEWGKVYEAVLGKLKDKN